MPPQHGHFCFCGQVGRCSSIQGYGLPETIEGLSQIVHQ